jgi:hypothetical protein
MALPPGRRLGTLARTRARSRRPVPAVALAAGLLLLGTAIGVGALSSGSPGAARPAAPETAGAVTGSERGTLRRLGGAGLTLRVVGSSTAGRIVNEYLPPVEAKGVFLLVDVTASNARSEPTVFASGQLGLRLAGVRYPVDSAALAALELAGHRALAGADVAPGATTNGWLVFDVPTDAAGSTPEVCLSGAGGPGGGGSTCG